MLEVSSEAALAIADTCKSRALGDDGGVRLYARSPDGNPHSLAVEFIDGPRAGDRVLEAGSARVFVAGNVSDAVGKHVLDVDGDGNDTHLRLRRR